MSATAMTHRARPRLARLLLEWLGFVLLLFVARFIARGYLALQMDQECHVGGIAVELLAHGLRFPLEAYAPNEYDNGTFFSGVLAALSFSLLGRNTLALKLVTHLIAATGAFGTLLLLRRCLGELGFTIRRQRWAAIAVLVIGLALAPRVVTIFSMYAVGNHAEGSAIGVLLLVLYAYQWRTSSLLRRAGFWVLVGVALYLNKGTLLVIPVLGLAELVLHWRAPRRIVAAVVGFVIGALFELRVMALQLLSGWGFMSWKTVLSKEQRNSRAFPGPFLDTVQFLAEYRVELLLIWIVALATGVALLIATLRRARAGDAGDGALPASPPVALGLVVGVSLFHLAALSVMAKSGLDAYVIYGYPTLLIQFALLVAVLCANATRRWGETAGAWAGAAAIAATVFLYRPVALTWGTETVVNLWNDRNSAACSWRYAEGFRREHEYGLVPVGAGHERHVIDRCRMLDGEDQQADCIGGMSRELHWRQPDGTVKGGPPAELSDAERFSYAFQYGTHRKGRREVCADFADPQLGAACDVAVTLECLHYADLYTRIAAGRLLGRPHCPLGEAPPGSFWAARRAAFLARAPGGGPDLTRAWGDDNLDACQPVFDACF